MPESVLELKPLDFSKAASTTLFASKPGVETLFMDDFGNTAATAGTANLSGATNGDIEVAGDTDWFEITVAQGETITVINPGPGFDYRLMNADGSVADPGSIIFDGEAFEDIDAGTYYIEVASTSGPSPYNLTIRKHLDDHGDNIANATATTSGGGGNIEYNGDADVFSVIVAAGETFELSYMVDPNIFFSVRNASNAAVAASDTLNSGIETSNSFEGLAPGTYYISVSGMAFSSSGTTYGFGANTYIDDHGNDSMTTSSLAAQGGTASGSLQAALDEDWFEMSVTNGQQVRIATTGLTNQHNLEFRDSGGTEIPSGTDPGNGDYLLTPNFTGTLYVVIGHENGPGPRQTANYTLSTVVPDDFEDDATTTGVVDLSGATTGSIEFTGDDDWFAVTLADNESLRVFDSNPVIFERVGFELLNSDGTVAQTGVSVFDGGPVDTVVFDELGAGTYYLSVTSLNNSASQDYNFVARTFVDDHGDEIATATALNGATTQSGVLESPSDEDWFSIEISAGGNVEFSNSFFPGPGGDVSTVLFDASGNAVTGAVNTGSPAGFNYTGYSDLAAGTYYVRAEAQGFVMTNAGYTFNINVYTDDHGNTAATATSLASLNGQDTGVLNAATDRDVFTVDLVAGEVFHFTTTGLPGGFNQVQVTRNGVAVDIGEAPHVTSFSFTPTITDTYEITIRLDPMFAGSAPANYTVSTAIPDDFGDTAGTAGSLTRFGTTFGTIEQAGDSDWFSVSVANGQSLVIGEDSSDFEFRLLNADGTVVSEGTDFVDGNFFREVFSNLDGGTYYVEVTAPTGAHPLDYQISSTFFTDDHGNTLDDATATGFINGRIEIPADVDWFEFTLDDDVTMDQIFEIGSNIFSGGNGILFNFRNADGNLIVPAVNANPSFGPVQQFEGLTAGTYYIEVFDNPDVSFFGNYGLTARLHTDDHGDGIDTNSTIPLDGTASGTLQSLIDEDWFSVNLTAGEEFRLNSTLTGGGSAFMRLVDSDGNNISGLPVNNLDLLFTPTEDGQYFVVVSRDITPAVAGDIAYTLTTGLPDDFAGDTTTTGVVTLNGTTSGVIENVRNVLDSDWFAIELAASETAEVTFSTFQNLSYTFFDNDGNQVANAFMGNGVSSFAAQSTGTYYVAVTEIRDDLAQDVNYNFTTTTYFDDYAAGISTTGALTPGSSITGTYNSRNDIDWIAIDVEAGQTVKIDLNQSRFASDLRLVDANGFTLAFEQSNNVTGTSFVAYTATQTGTFYIQTSATSFNGPQAYELEANIIAPDVPDNISSTATIAVGNSLDSVLEDRFDEDWFGFSATNGELIRFTLEGPFASQVTLNIYSDTGVRLSQFSSLQRDNTTEVLTFDAPSSGNFFVEVDARFLSNTFTDYTLTAQNVADDFAGDATTTAVIAPGGTVTGAIDLRNDQDWVAFNVSEGEIINFEIEAEFSTNGMRIVDASGNTLQTAYFIETGVNGIDFISPSSGTFYLSLTNFVEGFEYSVTANTVIDDFGNDTTTTDSLTSGTIITGALHYRGDTDWFSISVSDGETIHALLRDTDSNPTTMRTSIYDASGNLVQSSNYSSSDSELVFTFNTGGDYFLAVEALQASGLINSDYSLSLNSVDLLGTSVSDILTGTSGDDVIIGLGSRDLIQGFEGDDTILAGAGSDRIEGGAGADHIDGGTDGDYVSFTTSDAGVTVDLVTGTGSGGHAEGDTYTNVEWIIGSSFDDVLIGNSEYNYFVGNDGADIMTGGGDPFQRDDFTYRTVTGHLNGDIITDFGFNDTINMFSVWETDTFIPTFIGADPFTGRVGEIRYEVSGNDTLVQFDIDGDGSVDETLTLLNYSDPLSMNADFIILGNSILTLGDFNSNLTGSDANNFIAAQGGNDTYFGLGGDDFFDGGDGNDFFNGGDGSDTAAYLDATSRVFVDLSVTGPQDTLGAGIDTLIDVENLAGSDFNDILFGDGNDNVLDGGAGNDYIMGADGDDTIIGGEGTSDWATYFSASAGVNVDLTISGPQDTGGAGIDTLSGIENLEGSSFADTLTGDAGDNYIDGRNGSDTLEGGDGNDIIDGGANSNGLGDFVAYATASSGVVVDLSITGAQDTVGAGIDTILNIENLAGSTHNDILTGDSNNNILIGGHGDDIMDGGAGTDWASYIFATGGVVVDLGVTGPQDTISDGIDTLFGFENIAGSAFDDILSGDAGDNTILAYTGDDIVSGGDGVDMLDGMEGNDTIFGDDGNDFIAGRTGDDDLFGGDGDDAIGGDEGMDLLDGGAGNDFLDGGADSDMASYASASSGVFVNLSITGPQNTGGAGIDTLVNIEQLGGSDFRDILLGNNGSNVILGGDGFDYIDGGASGDFLDGGDDIDWVSYLSAGNGVIVDLSETGVQNTGAGPDIIRNFENLEGSLFRDMLYGDDGDNFIDGQAGNDYIRGGLGNDRLDGGAGTSDWVSYADASGGVIVDLGLTTAQDTISDGIDTLSGFENLEGSAFDDILIGDSANNFIDGMDGNDVIIGTGGTNTLLGGDGHDDIFGASSNDVLIAGYGMDFLDGGMGDDLLDGGAGPDMASYGSATGRVIVDLSITTAQDTIGAGIDTLISIEQLEGSDFNDILYGNGRSNYILGGDGNDYIDGGASGDFLDGGAGTSDWVSYQSETRGVTVDLSNTGVQATNDIIVNFENLEGSDFGDNLSGNSDANFIDGQDGNDLINGGAGNDILNGGAGGDLFIFDAGFGTDTVLDYQDGADQLQFRINGLTSFSQLTVTQDGADTLITYDGNSVRLSGITATDITSADVAFAAPPAPAEPNDNVDIVSEKLTNFDVVSETPDSFDFKTDVDVAPIAEVMDEDLLSDSTGDIASQILEIGAELAPEAMTFVNEYGVLSIITDDEDGYWDMVG